MTIAEDILNRAIQIGTEKSQLANQAAVSAQTAAMGYTTLVAPILAKAPGVVEPLVDIPQTATGVDRVLFTSTHDKIINDLAGRFGQFFHDYFPIDAALMQSVQDWLSRAINVGGSGINAVVENQLWQRDRDRLGRAAAAAGEEAISSWAAKGFPLPPGAGVAAVQQILRERDTQIYSQSRDRAIKTFEQEIENVKFAITTAVDYRIKAIQAAGEYIRTLALGPQIAATLSTAAINAQATLINAAASFYDARIKVSELKFSSDKMNAEMTLRAGEKSLDSFSTGLQVRANTAVAVATSLGTQASAALNAVNGTAQVIQQIES